MSLNGNLEDLPLLDILQIVSFSKKTGYLAIQAALGEGAIVFREGLVVASFTWDSLPVDPRAASLPEAKRYALVRNRIALALEHLIRLREGQFSFNLTEEIPASIAGRDITGETLPAGINPQELLLDLARGIDEDRRDSSAALEASFAQPLEEEIPLDLPVAPAEDVESLVQAEPAPPSTAEEPAPAEEAIPAPAPAALPAPPPVPPAPAPAAPAPPPAVVAGRTTLLLVDD